jgi:hypothetical protein
MLVNNSASTLADGYWVCVLQKAIGKRIQATMKERAKRTADSSGRQNRVDDRALLGS